jgi:hypothetical protein
MRTINIKKGTLGIPPNTVEKTTIDLIRDSLNIPPPGGFTFHDYKKRARIERELDKCIAQTEIEPKADLMDCNLAFEDEDYAVLREIVRRGPYAIRAPFLSEFILSFE